MAKNKSSNPTAKKKLSALEKELLAHVKKGQPVLLYGKDTSRGRINLIKIGSLILIFDFYIFNFS